LILKLSVTIRDHFIQEAGVVNICDSLLVAHELHEMVINQFHEVKLIVETHMQLVQVVGITVSLVQISLLIIMISLLEDMFSWILGNLDIFNCLSLKICRLL